MSFDVVDIPLLPGWVMVAEAAEMLGLSKQAVHGMIRNKELKTTHRLGMRTDKPIYVIQESEVRALADLRSQSVVGHVK